MLASVAVTYMTALSADKRGFLLYCSEIDRKVNSALYSLWCIALRQNYEDFNDSEGPPTHSSVPSCWQ